MVIVLVGVVWCGLIFVQYVGGQYGYVEGLYLVCIGMCYLEYEVVQGQFVVGFRQVVDGFGYQVVDCVVVIVGEGGVEMFVEIFDWGQCVDYVLVVGLDCDLCGVVFGFVMFVVDFVDDLFQYVFDGDQFGDIVVFVDYDGYVVV